MVTTAPKLACVPLAVVLWVAGAGQSAAPPQEHQAPHIDASIELRLSRGRAAVVQFYRRGPLAPTRAGQPNEYIRGVAIVEAHRTVARWEADPTTIPTFYPRLNTVRGLAKPNQVLITAAVQYGGRLLNLWALIWVGGSIQKIQEWAAQDFSIRLMGSPPRLVVIAVPEDYSKIPDIYGWDGSVFRGANNAYPRYFGALGAREKRAIKDDSRKLPPVALVDSCRRSLEAYRRAGEPELGREVCEEARERIRIGKGLVPGVPGEARQAFENERREAAQEIDDLLHPQPGAKPD